MPVKKKTVGGFGSNMTRTITQAIYPTIKVSTDTQRTATLLSIDLGLYQIILGRPYLRRFWIDIDGRRLIRPSKLLKSLTSLTLPSLPSDPLDNTPRVTEIPNNDDKVAEAPPVIPKPVPTQILRRPPAPSVEDDSSDPEQETTTAILEEPHRRNGRLRGIKKRKGKLSKAAFLQDLTDKIKGPFNFY